MLIHITSNQHSTKNISWILYSASCRLWLCDATYTRLPVNSVVKRYFYKLNGILRHHCYSLSAQKNVLNVTSQELLAWPTLCSTTNTIQVLIPLFVYIIHLSIKIRNVFLTNSCSYLLETCNSHCSQFVLCPRTIKMIK